MQPIVCSLSKTFWFYCMKMKIIECTTLHKSRSSELTLMKASKWHFLIECLEQRALDGVCTLCQCPMTSIRDVSFRATWGEKGRKYVSCMSQGLIEYGIYYLIIYGTIYTVLFINIKHFACERDFRKISKSFRWLKQSKYGIMNPDLSNYRYFTLNLDLIAYFQKQNFIFDRVKVSFRKRNLWLSYSLYNL